MNNQEIFKIMFNGLKADIDYRLSEGDNLEKAKAYARDKSAAARRAAQEKEDLARRADYALNAMLARAEAMTMTA